MARSETTRFWHDVLDNSPTVSTSIAQSKLASPAAFSQHSLLLKLPQEILEEVVSYLLPPESSGLLQLRTACRQLHASVDKFVGPAYFSNRTFVLADEESLKTLQSISYHPTFRKSMKHVEFALVALPSKEVRGDDSNAILEYAGFPQFMREIRFFNYRRPSNTRPLGQWDHKRLKFVREGLCAQYLHTILTNFMNVGSIPSIATEGVRMVTRIHASGNSSVPFPNRLDHEELALVFKAICCAQYPINEFKFGCSNTGVSLENSDYLCSSPAFSRLKTLELTFRRLRYPWIYGPRDQIDPGCYYTRQHIREGVRDFIFFLRSAANLEDLTLGLSDDEIDLEDCHAMVFDALVEEVSSRSEERALRYLQVFHLKNLCYWRLPRHFIAFVRATRSTLKVLRLDGAFERLGLPAGQSLARRVLRAYGSEELQLRGDVWTVDYDSDDPDNIYDW